MTLIDRHVLRTFLRILMWSLIAFLAVFILFDLVDHIDDFIDDEATISAVLRYYLYLIPQYLDFCLPISMLLASMFTMGILSKNREYTAILASGVSLLRMSRTILVTGILITGLALLWREGVVAEANRRHHDVKEYEIERKDRDRIEGRRNYTHVDESGRVYVISRFRPRPPTLDNLSVQTFSDSTLVRRIDAKRAVWVDGGWELRDGTVRSFDAQGRESVERFDVRRLGGVVEPPEAFARRKIHPEDMTWRELKQFADWVDRTGGDSTRYRAEMAHKLSFPLVNFLVVLLGLAIGASRRRTTLWAGFGVTVGLAFGYYLLMDFGLELGRSGALPPLVSAWTGNLIYGIGGIALFWRSNH